MLYRDSYIAPHFIFISFIYKVCFNPFYYVLYFSSLVSFYPSLKVTQTSGVTEQALLFPSPLQNAPFLRVDKGHGRGRGSRLTASSHSRE